MKGQYRTTPQKPTNTPVELVDEEALLFKCFFSDEKMVPVGIRKIDRGSNAMADAKRLLDAKNTDQPLPERGAVRPGRIDTGLLRYDADLVYLRLLRTGIANAEGHRWGLADVHYWQQEVNGQPGKFQYVVCCSYNIDPAKRVELSRAALDGLRILAGLYTWGKVRIWTNDFGPCTVNCTSPRETNVADPKMAVAVRDNCLGIWPIAAA